MSQIQHRVAETASGLPEREFFAKLESRIRAGGQGLQTHRPGGGFQMIAGFERLVIVVHAVNSGLEEAFEPAGLHFK